ncbi:hypothetical protein [Flavobacterium chungangensis]|uniref:Uncharacterized protein n=1 Tax=Flavobacterium chungangensis TaxID=2708132 RepID=A0ABV8ZEH1_9FLAO
MNRFKRWYNNIVKNGTFKQKLFLAISILIFNYTIAIIPAMAMILIASYFFSWSVSFLTAVIISMILDIIARIVKKKYNQ